MTAEELAEVIEDLLRSVTEDEAGAAEELCGAQLASFARAGLLTDEAGVVITLADDAEFQVTIVQSRIGNHDEDEA